MKKFSLWLVKTALAAGVAAMVSMTTSWVVVNGYMQQLLGKYGMLGTVSSMGAGELLSALNPSNGAPPSKAGNGSEGTAEGSPDQPASAEPSAGQGNSGASGETMEDGERPVPANALPVMGQAYQSNQSNQSNGEFYLSMDELNEKKDNISNEERMEIFAMLVTKLPPEEVQEISALMEDGLDAEELESAAAIIQAYLSEDEFARLIDILQK